MDLFETWRERKARLRTARRELRLGVEALREHVLHDADSGDGSRTRVTLTGVWRLCLDAAHTQLLADAQLQKLCYRRLWYSNSSGENLHI